MHITVEFLSTFRELAGCRGRQLDLPDGTDLRQLLKVLVADGETDLGQAVLDAGGEIAPGVVILVNGHSCALAKGLDTPITDGDMVSFMAHIAGG
jgi:molybdopterin converting factor small subunit